MRQLVDHLRSTSTDRPLLWAAITVIMYVRHVVGHTYMCMCKVIICFFFPIQIWILVWISAIKNAIKFITTVGNTWSVTSVRCYFGHTRFYMQTCLCIYTHYICVDIFAIKKIQKTQIRSPRYCVWVISCFFKRNLQLIMFSTSHTYTY